MSPPRERRLRQAALFTALLSTAIALAGALAHAFELPNKIWMSRDDYFIVQRIYSGWNQFAYVLAVELIAILAVIALHRRRPVRLAALVALAALAGSQVVFWTFTYPANVATANWTTVPENWHQLRTQWEYSHLAGAAFQLVAMIAMIAAALGSGQQDNAEDDVEELRPSDNLRATSTALQR